MYRLFSPGKPIRAVAAALLTGALAVACLAAAEPPAPTKPAATGAPGVPVTLPAWNDVAGKTYGRKDVAASAATVFVFTSTQCPIANIYTPRLIALGRDYGKRGVRFFLVHSNAEDTAPVVRRYAKERAFPFPSVKDRGTTLADLLGAGTTPEAVVLDSRAVVRYRGRIDDNKDRSKVFRQDVRDALDALLAGKPVARPRALAFGCTIFRDTPRVAAAPAGTEVTYARHVAPILYKNCVSCHRPGDVGPFPLETYAQARAWASAIKDYTARRLMPPWKAVPGHGEFHDARALTEAEIATLTTWADSGARQGDPKATPTLPTFPPAAAWTLGKPDRILQSPRPYHVAAEGKDVYRQFVLPIDFSEDVYLSGIEFKPDNRAIVHHMIAYLDPTGKSAELDGKEKEPGYSVPGTGIGVKGQIFLAGWAPGNLPRLLPSATAYRLTKGAKLVLQVHYNKNGKVEADQSRIGLHFAKGPVEREMRTWAAMNDTFVLKPGVPEQKVTGEFRLNQDVHVWAVSPHMHMLGREMRLTALLPDGATRSMVWINDWDFNWQETYAYKEPLKLPKGTRVRVDAVFDNSDKNPRQPTLPPKEVRFGEQTTDEMCIGFFMVTVDAERLGIPASKTARR